MGSAVTSNPSAFADPSMISASTRFLAHPKLIIPTFFGVSFVAGEFITDVSE